MANTIKLKKDSSSGGEPTVNSNASESNNGLAAGEVAINYRDGKLFFANEALPASFSLFKSGKIV